MAHYMFRLALAPETFNTLLANPDDHRDASRRLIEAHGGTLREYYFAFGRYDAIIIAELPDNVDAAAVMMTAAASGGFAGGETTALLTPEEAVSAMRRAAEKKAAYRAPSARRRRAAGRARGRRPRR
ncbi:MAG: GYD domain-containing protein [Rhodospirillaceae bacterium]|nr:GYD domain-containing protein [Rhodospirillaceae bacterium]